MENNIPLRNLNQDLNHEERQEIDNSTVTQNNFRSNQSDEGFALCGIGIIATIVFVGLAYLLGSESCKKV
jgi:hypothetical protein